MGTEVKFMHSSMTGAPSVSGTAGTLIALLDACLINGFGLGNVDSVVISGGIATVTRASGHPFEVGSVALIAGATVTGGSINGEQRVLTVPSSTVYTFDATGIANQTATGTITHKVAPLAWSKAFSGTNLAAYKSLNIASTGMYLYVDDTGTFNARVLGRETMTSISDTTGPAFPTTTQVSGGLYWGKSNLATSATRNWMLCGDDRGFYIAIGFSGTSPNQYNTHYFGDFISRKSSDPYACTISGGQSDQTQLTLSGITTANDLFSAANSIATHQYGARAVTGLGSATGISRCPQVLIGTVLRSGQTNQGISYPNPSDNGLFVGPMNLFEATTAQGVYRGTLPGVYYSLQAIGGASFAARDRVTGVTGLSGRDIRAIPIIQGDGVGFIDMTGPWR